MSISNGEALRSIYDAAVDHHGWSKALDIVVSDIGALGAALLVRNRGNDPYAAVSLSQAYMINEGKDVAEYIERYSHHEADDWVVIDRQKPCDPILDTEAGLTIEERDARPDYVFLRERFGIGRRIGFRLNENKVWFDAVTVCFPTEQPVIPAQCFDLALGFAPHMARSVQIGRMFSDLQKRYKAVLSVLDRVGVGLAIALPDGELIVTNAEADRILSFDDGVSLSSDRRLRTYPPDLAAELNDAIVRLGATAGGRGSQSQHSALIPRQSFKSPFIVEVSPLRDARKEIDADFFGCLIVFIDPDHVPHLDLNRFQRLYGLSLAEADVCRLILGGSVPAEVAEIRGTSQNTTKAQIAAIYQKTGARHRSDLVGLIVRVLPPVL